MVENNLNTIHIGSLSRIKPTVNFANHSLSAPGTVWGPRMIPDCQLLYLISGHACIALGPQEFELGPGDCVFYGTNTPHIIISSDSDPMNFLSMHFSWEKESPEPDSPVEKIEVCSRKELSIPPLSYSVDVEDYGNVVIPHHMVVPNIEGLFMQIVREYRFEERGYSAVLRGLLTQLLVVIVRHQINEYRTTEAWRKISSALEAIRKQPNRSWKTAELAQLCGYHPTYLAEIFKEMTGHSPKHYLILERIRKAKQFLLETESVEKVADHLGYTSVHYFCRNFKEVTGLTPTEFKRRNIEL